MPAWRILIVCLLVYSCHTNRYYARQRLTHEPICELSAAPEKLTVYADSTLATVDLPEKELLPDQKMVKKPTSFNQVVKKHQQEPLPLIKPVAVKKQVVTGTAKMQQEKESKKDSSFFVFLFLFLLVLPVFMFIWRKQA